MAVKEGVIAVARRRLRAEAEAVHHLADTLDHSFIDAAELTMRCHGKVFVGGSGTSGSVARRMAHILSVSGTPAVFLSPMDSLHGASGAITSDDMVILISHGGASSEVIESAKIARARGARVLSITGSLGTLLAAQADCSVVIPIDPAAEIGGIIATGSTLAQSAWGDALAEVLMRARGYTWEQFAETHPAGAVGLRSHMPEDLARLDLATGSDVSEESAR